ncbi:efflux RND transporter periplasmic adaptor subunit [Desulfobacula sp.]|uniref:efflux RND transporter periplasmic adaptor subunit n=1 Tax=Desulfobacula sp. TaxID=2593537 RepID=UPI0025BC6781|nr:efflux RND transporter periplasmic adaptor subunit [Desulfobacula sp.]MBC2704134.1 efflux RND transporter periplasmic adaptor subunit [Desulfobacula sp.]
MRVFQALLILAIINGSMVYAREQPPARVVISKIVFQKVAQNRSFIGTLYYERISHVSSEVSGLVTQIDVRDGDQIQKGTPLVYLNTEILEKEILIRKNQIDQAELHINHSKKNYQRMESLYKKGGISEKGYDDARFVYQEALLKKVSARTILEKLLIQKRKSVINAPFDGIILEKNVDSGDWVQQGKQLISIGSVNDLFIKVPVAETLLKFVVVGQKVPVIINAYNKELTGIIDNLSPIADEKTKNIFLKIRIPMLTKVAQNMSATVFIPTGNGQKMAMIPRDAVIKFQGNDVVYTIKEEKAAMLPVNIVTYLGNTIGVDNEHFIEGMPVIVEGNERLRPGQSVTIVGEK